MRLAFLAGLLPGIGIVVLGLILLTVVGRSVREEVDQELREGAVRLAQSAHEAFEQQEQELDAFLMRPPREPRGQGAVRLFDLIRPDHGPWGLPFPPATWRLLEGDSQGAALDLSTFLPAVEELEFHDANAQAAADQYQDMVRWAGNDADLARYSFAWAGALDRAGKWEESLAALQPLLGEFSFQSSVDGMPLELTVALQQISIMTRLADRAQGEDSDRWREQAETRARNLLVALDQDTVAVPIGESAATLTDALEQLQAFVPDPPGWKGSLRAEDLALRRELERYAATLPEAATSSRALVELRGEPAVLLLRSEPRIGRLTAAWLPLATLADQLEAPAPGLTGRFDLVPATEDEHGAPIPGLESLQALLTASPDLASARLAPWRLAVGTSVALVALMSLASAFLASQAVARRLRFARLQGELVASISHELRTPLTAMLLNLELLEDPRLTEDRRQENTRRVRHSAQRLQRMVERVLTLARTERGHGARHVEAVPVEELFETACEELGAVLPPDQVPRRVAAGLPPAWVDRDDLVQVLVGLLDNAVRHAPGAPPTLNAAMDGDGTLRLEVADLGPGVPEEAHAHLFEPFHRGARSSAGGTQGVGLGLAIAKGLVEAAGGRIQARATRPGQQPEGLTLVLNLPVAHPDHDHGAPA